MSETSPQLRMQLTGSDREKIRLALPNVPPLRHQAEISLLSHDSDSRHRNKSMLSEDKRWADKWGLQASRAVGC